MAELINIIITLIIAGIILFILSFFTHDRMKALEQQIEELSVTTLKDSYQLKKKIKVLEEELLTDMFTENVEVPTFNESKKEDQLPPLYKQVKKMYDIGFSIDDIAKSTTLKRYDIQAILHQIDPNYKGKKEGEA